MMENNRVLIKSNLYPKICFRNTFPIYCNQREAMSKDMFSIEQFEKIFDLG